MMDSKNFLKMVCTGLLVVLILTGVVIRMIDKGNPVKSGIATIAATKAVTKAPTQAPSTLANRVGALSEKGNLLSKLLEFLDQDTELKSYELDITRKAAVMYYSIKLKDKSKILITCVYKKGAYRVEKYKIN